MAREEVENCFNDRAVEKGFVTIGQVMKALKIQIRRDKKFGNNRLIGLISFDVGLVTLPQNSV